MARSHISSLVLGVADLLDFWGVLSDSAPPARSDAEAIASDWQAVRDDLGKTYDQMVHEQEEEAAAEEVRS